MNIHPPTSPESYTFVMTMTVTYINSRLLIRLILLKVKLLPSDYTVIGLKFCTLIIHNVDYYNKLYSLISGNLSSNHLVANSFSNKNTY